MSELYVGTAMVIAPALIGALGGYLIKRWEVKYHDEKVENDLWNAQRRSHWLPLLRTVVELENRLEHLRRIYLREPNTSFTPESLSGDFRELYALRRDSIANLEDCDPNPARKDAQLVQRVRTRVCHQLTFAESSLYLTVKYLGMAERVLRDLHDSVLILPDESREQMIKLVTNVRRSLQGHSGAGIFEEQQQYIGEAVWTPAGQVISNLDFRRLLFDLPGWEQFANLLRFFVEFEPKVNHEVAGAIEALKDLRAGLDRLCARPDERSHPASWLERARGRWWRLAPG